MAEEDSSQEKTEEPTAKKLEKARDDGQVARSKELNTLLVLVFGSFGLLFFGASFYQGGVDLFQFNMMLDRDTIFDPQQMGLHVFRSAIDAVSITMPLFLLILLAAFIGPVSMGGWLVSPKAMAPKFSRMSFPKGLGRMFSLNALMELAKALGKFLVVAASAVLILYFNMPKIQLLGQQSVDVAIPIAAYTLVLSFLLMSLSILVIAAIDIPFQIVEHTKKLKMTVQEVKDEMKNTEGKPEVKSRIRQLQQEMARGRMMSEVPDADVIITNPSHFSVALKYDPDNMASPMLVAKGVDNVAALIKEVAIAHDITIVSYPILARSLFYSTDINQFVPQGLYVAVAQILAYVFQLKQYRKGQGAAPRPLGNLDIPDEFVQMANKT
ncbi:MAG: flagellar biosynthesis protein FlhB [Pseudomonadales bacterium]|nr:flagellar biosynthesis protein FlhB [Pseudomonadales bacterium]